MAVPATLEKLKVLLYVGDEAPVQSIEMYFTVRIEKSFSLEVGKDGVEEIKHSHINVSPEPFDSDGYKGKIIYSTNNEQKHNIQGKYLYLNTFSYCCMLYDNTPINAKNSKLELN